MLHNRDSACPNTSAHPVPTAIYPKHIRRAPSTPQPMPVYRLTPQFPTVWEGCRNSHPLLHLQVARVRSSPCASNVEVMWKSWTSELQPASGCQDLEASISHKLEALKSFLFLHIRPEIIFIDIHPISSHFISETSSMPSSHLQMLFKHRHKMQKQNRELLFTCASTGPTTPKIHRKILEII